MIESNDCIISYLPIFVVIQNSIGCPDFHSFRNITSNRFLISLEVGFHQCCDCILHHQSNHCQHTLQFPKIISYF